MGSDIELHITQETAYKIRRAVLHDKTLEVGGLLRIERVQPADNADNTDTYFRATDIRIPPQEVQSAHFDVGAKDFHKYLVELANETAQQEQTSLWSIWRGIWHSHASMGTSPSNTDTEQLWDLLREEQLSWMIGLVVNTKMEMTSWLIVREPLHLRATVIPSVEPPDLAYLDREIDEQLKDVRRKTYPLQFSKHADACCCQQCIKRQVDNINDTSLDDETIDDMDDEDAKAAAAAYADMAGVVLTDEDMDDLIQMFKRGNGRITARDRKSLCQVGWVNSTGGFRGCMLPQGHSSPQHLWWSSQDKDEYETFEPGKGQQQYQQDTMQAGRCKASFKGNQCVLSGSHKDPSHAYLNKDEKVIRWKDNDNMQNAGGRRKQRAARKGK